MSRNPEDACSQFHFDRSSPSGYLLAGGHVSQECPFHGRFEEAEEYNKGDKRRDRNGKSIRRRKQQGKSLVIPPMQCTPLEFPRALIPSFHSLLCHPIPICRSLVLLPRPLLLFILFFGLQQDLLQLDQRRLSRLQPHAGPRVFQEEHRRPAGHG